MWFRAYVRQRLIEKISGRTINMELGELSRAIGHKWSVLWPKLRKMEERKDVGRALPPEEQQRLLVGLEFNRFEAVKPDTYLFPWGKPTPSDPTRHITDISSSWDELRKETGVGCRLHDLRHTFATQLAENGVSESTMLALMGHMSRAMLERYSHLRMAAKRHAVAGVTLGGQRANSNPVPVPERPTRIQ